ncbi:unnamed protein product [Schistosoma rodhaini]|uniref:DM domain-containing protein n=2 Tax=Schistosoma rodhaini TaxID=6188 RepID=A0AA85G4G5_9TREM|nr:unnamed protein product [Schistosoma rodhaini]CAH8608446.1 unnamed protein product [Schistosoma rodhaini]
MNDYIYTLPITQPFKNINNNNDNFYSTAFTTTIAPTTSTNTSPTGTITVNKTVLCNDVSNDQKDYCYNYTTEPQQFESIPLSLFNIQKQNDPIVNNEYYVSDGNLLNNNNHSDYHNILPTQSYPFYPVKYNELTKDVYHSIQTSSFNKNDLDIQAQSNYMNDNINHNNNNDNNNNPIQLPTTDTYEYQQQVTPIINEQYLYTTNILDKFITKNDWNQQTIITESSNLIKCKTQNSLCHTPDSKNSTGFISLNENNHLEHQRLPHLTSDLDCHIPNLSDYSIISKNDEVNTSQTKSTYHLPTELNRKRKSSNHIPLEKSMSLFHDQHSSLSKYHHTLKTNRPTHKFTYHSTNTYNANGNYTTCNNVTRHLKSLQNKHITPDNTCCHTYDSYIHNENLLQSFNNKTSSKVKNQTIIPSSSSSSNSILSRSPYKCRKCKGHGMSEPVRQHKRNCPYRDCTCDMCYLVEKGRRIVAQQIALFRDQKNHNIQKLSYQKDRSIKNIIIKESLNNINEDNGPHCRRCRNHGHNISWKGHKKTCPYKECYCDQCILISLRKSNEKDLREVTQEFIDSQPENGEKKTSTKNTSANYETNTCSFNEKCYIINSNFSSTTSEDYNHNALYNPYSNNDPVVSFDENCKAHDSFYPPLVNKTCVNSLIHHLVTSSNTTTLDPFYTTHISKCENKQICCSSTTFSHLKSIENPNLEPSTYREAFNNITKSFNFSENTNSLNFDKNEFNSQKIPDKTEFIFHNNHNCFSSFDCPTSLISSTISTNKIHESDHNTSQLVELNSTQTFCNSNMNTGSSLIRTKYDTIVNPNISFKTNYLNDFEVNSTNHNSEQFLSNQSIEINKSMLENKYHESYITDCSQDVSMDCINSNNDHFKNLDQQFRSQFNKEYINSNFYHLQGYQKPNSSSLISSSTLKNTITDYIYHSEEKNTIYPTDYLSHSVNLNEDKLIRPTTNHAAALAAAAAAAVAFHHEVVSQQKHQEEYTQHIEDIKQVYKQSDVQLEQQNLFNTNNITTITTTTTTTTTTTDTISNMNNNHNINSMKDRLNMIQESINTPLNFLNMSNMLNDEKQNYSNDHLMITSPLLQSIQTNYKPKIVKSNENSLKNSLNLSNNNNNIKNNNQYNHNLDLFTHYSLDSNKQQQQPPPQQQPQKPQQQQQQYLTKDTLNIHNYNTIKYNNITDYIQYNSNIKLNHEINKLQIIHLTNAIILPSKQSSLKQIPYEYNNNNTNINTTTTTNSNNNDNDTWNSLPNECNNLFKKFDVSSHVFKHIGL